MLLGTGQLNLSTNLGPLDPLCVLHSGEDYETLRATAVTVSDGTLELQAIDLETLIRVKTEAGRAKDRLTVPLLLALRDAESSESE